MKIRIVSGWVLGVALWSFLIGSNVCAAVEQSTDPSQIKQEKRIYYDRNGNRDGYDVMYYNSLGDSVKFVQYGKSGKIEWYQEYIYDSHGSLFMTVSRDRRHRILDYQTYVYNEHKKCIRYSRYDKDGILEEFTYYRYLYSFRPEGDLYEEWSYSGNGKLLFYKYYDYNISGLRAVDTMYGSTGHIVSQLVYRYDSNGRLKATWLYCWELRDVVEHNEFTYNASGQIIRNATYGRDESLEGYYTMKYDQHGLISQYVFYDGNKQYTSSIVCRYTFY